MNHDSNSTWKSLRMTDEKMDALEEALRTNDYSKIPELTGALGKVASTGTKRKPSDLLDDDNDDGDDDDLDGVPIDKTCNQVRGQIRRFLDGGGMKVGEFCKAIRVSNKSLNDFLRHTGSMDGAGSSTYGGAWAFFKRRELKGIKMPTKKKAKTTPSDGQPKQTTAKASAVDISSIHLDGEEDKTVEIYDTCDEVRRKINTHLRNTNVSQAQFCRDLAEQLPGSTKVQSKQLTDFRNKKGARAGNTSCVFYAAYIYFEKIRIAEGKPKSKHRVDMEGVWVTGFDIVHGSHHAYITSANPTKQLCEDELGRLVYR